MSEDLTDAQKAAIEKMGDSPAASPSPRATGLTTVAEILQGYKQSVITLPVSKWTVEIQSLPPGDYMTIYGSAIRALMTAQGLDAEDQEARGTYQQKLTPDQRRYVSEHNLQNSRRIAVKAVTSLELSHEPQYLCQPGVLSVQQVSDGDVLFIDREVDKLSGWSADVDRFQGSVEKSEG
jgi:hypothetical protein